MRKKVYIVFLISMLVTLTSVVNVTYTYDSAGNRIKKEIPLNTISEEDNDEIEVRSYSERLAKKTVTIYPNPTQGILKVAVKGWEDTDACEYLIYNQSGQLLKTASAISPITEIDLSTHKNGIYIMSIVINGTESSWKIIKE